MTDNKPIFDPDHRVRSIAVVTLAAVVIVGLALLMLADVVARSA